MNDNHVDDDDDDRLSGPEWLAAMKWRQQARRERYTIPTVATVRICQHIEPDQARGDDYVTLERKYAALTEPMPLKGAEAMARASDGSTRLVSRIRSAAPWMTDAIGIVDEQVELSLWAGDPWLRLRPLLLVGGPGTGKSYFARLVAEATGCQLIMLPLGGDNDARSLGGTARGWLGAQPALPVVGMAQGASANPVIVLDELDKVSPDRRAGSAWDVLLSMLEPVTAGAWYDRCLMSAVDLRHVVWVATANSVHAMPAPLLSRFDVVTVSAPRPEHVPALLDTFRAEFAATRKLPISMLPPITPGEEALLVDHFARTRSLRQLRRGCEIALRGAIRAMGRSVQ